MDKLRAYNVLCEQIEKGELEYDRLLKRTGQHSPKQRELIEAMKEGAKLLNWDLHLEWIKQEATKNIADKNFKLIERSLLIDALCKTEKELFDLNSITNLIRKMPSIDFATMKDLEDFLNAAQQVLLEESKQALEEAKAAVPVADEIS